jgi:hypothetical protein
MRDFAFGFVPPEKLEIFNPIFGGCAKIISKEEAKEVFETWDDRFAPALGFVSTY